MTCIENRGGLGDQIADGRYKFRKTGVIIGIVSKKITSSKFTVFLIRFCPSQPVVTVEGGHHGLTFKEILIGAVLPGLILLEADEIGVAETDKRCNEKNDDIRPVSNSGQCLLHLSGVLPVKEQRRHGKVLT